MDISFGGCFVYVLFFRLLLLGIGLLGITDNLIYYSWLLYCISCDIDRPAIKLLLLYSPNLPLFNNCCSYVVFFFNWIVHLDNCPIMLSHYYYFIFNLYYKTFFYYYIFYNKFIIYGSGYFKELLVFLLLFIVLLLLLVLLLLRLLKKCYLYF